MSGARFSQRRNAPFAGLSFLPFLGDTRRDRTRGERSGGGSTPRPRCGFGAPELRVDLFAARSDSLIVSLLETEPARRVCGSLVSVLAVVLSAFCDAVSPRSGGSGVTTSCRLLTRMANLLHMLSGFGCGADSDFVNFGGLAPDGVVSFSFAQAGSDRRVFSTWRGSDRCCSSGVGAWLGSCERG